MRLCCKTNLSYVLFALWDYVVRQTLHMWQPCVSSNLLAASFISSRKCINAFYYKMHKCIPVRLQPHHYCGPWPSIRPYLSESDNKLSHLILSISPQLTNLRLQSGHSHSTQNTVIHLQLTYKKNCLKQGDKEKAKQDRLGQTQTLQGQA